MATTLTLTDWVYYKPKGCDRPLLLTLVKHVLLLLYLTWPAPYRYGPGLLFLLLPEHDPPALIIVGYLMATGQWTTLVKIDSEIIGSVHVVVECLKNLFAQGVLAFG